VSLPPLPSDEDTASFRRPVQHEDRTGDVVVAGQRLQLPPWGWIVIVLLTGGTGTTVGSALTVDWLGLRSHDEVQRLRLEALELRHRYELELLRCGCPTRE